MSTSSYSVLTLLYSFFYAILLAKLFYTLPKYFGVSSDLINEFLRELGDVG
jgi:hypothetical protein